MVEFKIGSTSIPVSLERIEFIHLRKRYAEIGRDAQFEFLSNFNQYKTADDLFGSFPQILEDLLNEVAAQCADDVTTHRIYTISSATLLSQLMDRVEHVQQDVQHIHDQYFAILGKASELNAQRIEAGASRGRVVGGGFGVEGAAQGMAVAAAANVAIGLTYGLANLTGQAASALGDRRKKRILLEAPETKQAMGDFLVRAAAQGAEIVAAAVNEASANPKFERVTEAQEQQSKALTENLLSGRVPVDDFQSVIVKALENDPFNAAAWVTWIDQFGDADGTVEASAMEIGVLAVSEHKATLLAKRRAGMSWTTPEQCTDNAIELGKYATWLNIPFEAQEAEIQQLSANLDRERRTYNGTEYATLDEVAQAQIVHAELVQRTFRGVAYDTLYEAEEAQSTHREQVIAASTANSLIGWMVLPYRRIGDLQGRSSKQEFGNFCLLTLAVLIVSVAIMAMSSPPQDHSEDSLSIFGILLGIFLLVYLPLTAVACLILEIRRFHDQNMSGWFTLLNLIPYVGWLIVLGFMAVDGTKGDNRFGPSPKHI